MIHQCHCRRPLRPNSVTGTASPVGNRPSRPASGVTLLEIGNACDAHRVSFSHWLVLEQGYSVAAPPRTQTFERGTATERRPYRLPIAPNDRYFNVGQYVIDNVA